MTVWNHIEVLGVKIPNKIAKSYCPIFSFWRWNFQDRNFTVSTDFFTHHQFELVNYRRHIMTLLRCWKFDFGWRKPTSESLTKRKVVFSKSCPIFKYELLWTQIWQIGWNVCLEINQSVNWSWYETKLRYWESKSRRKLQNHIVPLPQ